MSAVYLPDEIDLKYGNSFAKVSAWGATLTDLVMEDIVVVPRVEQPDVVNFFSGVTMAPWPNRLEGGEWTLNGAKLGLPTNDGKGNANHGLVYNRKFQILEQTESSVIYSYRLGEDQVYPFEVEIVVSYELNSNGFTSRIGAINHGSATAPVAFGTHPYFMAFPESKVTISAGKQSVSNEFQIPTGSEPATKVAPDLYSQMKLDDCFFELVRDENGVAETTVSNPDGTYFSVWQDNGFPYLTVFTHPNLGLAIEPQSSPANALNSGEGLALLETGAETFGTWGIKVGSGK